jgi:hypothetical protein
MKPAPPVTRAFLKETVIRPPREELNVIDSAVSGSKFSTGDFEPEMTKWYRHQGAGRFKRILL